MKGAKKARKVMQVRALDEIVNIEKSSSYLRIIELYRMRSNSGRYAASTERENQRMWHQQVQFPTQIAETTKPKIVRNYGHLQTYLAHNIRGLLIFSFGRSHQPRIWIPIEIVSRGNERTLCSYYSPARESANNKDFSKTHLK